MEGLQAGQIEILPKVDEDEGERPAWVLMSRAWADLSGSISRVVRWPPVARAASASQMAE